MSGARVDPGPPSRAEKAAPGNGPVIALLFLVIVAIVAVGYFAFFNVGNVGGNRAASVRDRPHAPAAEGR